jgi:hypothetical protein
MKYGHNVLDVGHIPQISKHCWLQKETCAAIAVPVLHHVHAALAVAPLGGTPVYMGSSTGTAIAAQQHTFPSKATRLMYSPSMACSDTSSSGCGLTGHIQFARK